MTANENTAQPPALFGPQVFSAAAQTMVIQDLDFIVIHFAPTAPVLTLVYEQSNDNVNWVTCPLTDLSSAAPAGKITQTANPTATMVGGTVPGKYFRIRCSAYTSGTVAAVVAAYEGMTPVGSLSVQGSSTGTPIPVTPSGPLPVGAVAKFNTSGNVANAVATAQISAPGAGITTYIYGLGVTGLGATAAGAATITLTGCIGSPQVIGVVGVPAGVGVPINPIIIEFATPIPASGPNVLVKVDVAAFGAGNTNAAAYIHGYAL